MNNDNVGGYGAPRKGRATLPFNLDKPDEQKIILHFKVMHKDPEVRARINQEVTRALKDITVGDYGLHAVITGDDMELRTVDAEILAKQTLPFILRALGMETVAKGRLDDF